MGRKALYEDFLNVVIDEKRGRDWLCLKTRVQTLTGEWNTGVATSRCPLLELYSPKGEHLKLSVTTLKFSIGWLTF